MNEFIMDIEVGVVNYTLVKFTPFSFLWWFLLLPAAGVTVLMARVFLD